MMQCGVRFLARRMMRLNLAGSTMLADTRYFPQRLKYTIASSGVKGFKSRKFKTPTEEQDDDDATVADDFDINIDDRFEINI